jgi:protein involved in polysaccharide export with SLBB domain
MSFFHELILAGLFTFGQTPMNNSILAQQMQMNPEIVKELEKKYKSGTTPKNKLSRYDQDSIYNRNLSKQESTDTLLIGLSDSSSKIEVQPKKKFLSIYERIMQGEDIQPDSLLSSLPVFGYDVFKNSRPSTFAPGDNAAVPSDYPINTDDEIVIMLWGRLNEEYRLKVDRNGTINIPRIGPIHVAGLTFEGVKNAIIDRVGKIEGVNATVSAGSLRSIGVYLVGEVTSPGYYTISALSNVINALFAAGGPTKSGSLRNVQLKRSGKLITSFDFYDFLLSGQDKTGYRLQSGDVIMVPIVKSMAAIVGNVRRPALYETNEKITLDKFISLAGGMTPSAWTNKIQIERYSKNQNRIIIDLDSSANKLSSIEIHDGDIVKIFPILEKTDNTIYLSGNVLRPGKYEFKDGMRIRDVLTNYNSILPETYFDYAVIYRYEAPTYINNILTFNLGKVLENTSSEDNLLLKARDEIIVYHRDFFEPDRFVFIDGAVTNAGRYKLLDNMKIRDLILQAGGLKDEASPIRGELYRRQGTSLERISTTKIDFCVDCAMQDSSADNISLQRFDHLFIRSKMGWEEERTVILKGQIVYPGTYVLYEGETLGDLIKRAGGFRDDAYLAAAVFNRKSVKELEMKRIDEYGRQMETDIMKLSAELASKENSFDAKEVLGQQMALKDKLKAKDNAGRVVIDLSNENNYQDFALENGDSLFVPRNLYTVSVLGEVYNPSTFKFDPKRMTVSEYIEAAGGLKESSDKKHIYIIKANGSIVTKKSGKVLSAKLEPGDAVMIPQKIKYVNGHKIFVDSADAFFKIASAITTVISVIILSYSINNQKDTTP